MCVRFVLSYHHRYTSTDNVKIILTANAVVATALNVQCHQVKAVLLFALAEQEVANARRKEGVEVLRRVVREAEHDAIGTSLGITQRAFVQRFHAVCFEYLHMFEDKKSKTFSQHHNVTAMAANSSLQLAKRSREPFLLSHRILWKMF